MRWTDVVSFCRSVWMMLHFVSQDWLPFVPTPFSPPHPHAHRQQLSINALYVHRLQWNGFEISGSSRNRGKRTRIGRREREKLLFHLHRRAILRCASGYRNGQSRCEWRRIFILERIAWIQLVANTPFTLTHLFSSQLPTTYTFLLLVHSVCALVCVVYDVGAEQTNCFCTGKNKDIKHIMIVIGLDVLTLIFMWVNACTYFRFDSTQHACCPWDSMPSPSPCLYSPPLSMLHGYWVCVSCCVNVRRRMPAIHSAERKQTHAPEPFTKLTRFTSVPFIKPTRRSVLHSVSLSACVYNVYVCDSDGTYFS